MEWCKLCTKGISNEQFAKYFQTCPDCYPKIKRNTVIGSIVQMVLSGIAGILIVFVAGPAMIAMSSLFGPPTQAEIGLITIIYILGCVLLVLIPVGLNNAIKFGKNLKNPEFIDKNWEKKLKKLDSN